MADTKHGDPESVEALLAAVPGALETLMGSRLLGDLPDQDRGDLVSRLMPRRYEAGEPIFDDTDADDLDVRIVLTGRVHVLAHGPAQCDELLAVLHPGELVGEYRALVGTAGRVHVHAAQPTFTAVLDRQDFLRVVETNPALCIRLLSQLVGTVRHMSGRVDGLGALDRGLDRLRRDLLRASI